MMSNLVVHLILMTMLAVPSTVRTGELVKHFLADLESFSFVHEGENVLKPILCAVCDGMPTHPDWFVWVPVSELKKKLSKTKMQKKHFSDVCSETLLNQHTAGHAELDEFLLSPKTTVNNSEEVMICKNCNAHLEKCMSKKGGMVFPPPRAICNGHVTGEPPAVLKALNQVELALVSGARIDCQSYIFFGGCHQQIRGWHTIYQNRVVSNVSSLELLRSSGLNGKIVVVLCGPFTRTQKALVMEQVQVNPEKVLQAFDWLRNHNIFFREMQIPSLDEIPLPIVINEDV